MCESYVSLYTKTYWNGALDMGRIVDREYIKIVMMRKLTEGETDTKRLCTLCGISYGTYLGIRKKNPNWAKKFDTVRKEAKAERYETILERLAEGTEVNEREETWMEEDEFGQKKQVKVKRKMLPPNEKAVGMLAKKYHKEIAGTEVTHKHEIGITIKDRALTMNERLNILKEDREEGQVIETTGKVVDGDV